MPTHSAFTHEPYSFDEPELGVPMPPPSVASCCKGDEETGSLSYTLNHIEVDGQTKISALDDPTLFSDYTPPSVTLPRESFEEKARIWKSMRRKVCFSLLLLIGLITGVVLLLQSFEDTPVTVVAVTNSNNTGNNNGIPTPANSVLSPTWAPNGGDSTDDFFNNENSVGSTIGQNHPNAPASIAGEELEGSDSISRPSPGQLPWDGEVSATEQQGQSIPTAPASDPGKEEEGSSSSNGSLPNQGGGTSYSVQQQGQGSGNGGGCRDRDDNDPNNADQQSQVQARGYWGGGGGGGGGNGGGCRNRGGGKCGCRGGGGGGGGGNNNNGDGGGNRRSLWEYLLAH